MITEKPHTFRWYLASIQFLVDAKEEVIVKKMAVQAVWRGSLSNLKEEIWLAFVSIMVTACITACNIEQNKLANFY